MKQTFFHVKNNIEGLMWQVVKSLDKTGFARIYYKKKDFSREEVEEKFKEIMTYILRNFEKGRIKFALTEEEDNFLVVLEKRGMRYGKK